MKCPNCGATITCGCKKRTAVDGTKCCARCVTELNRTIENNIKLSIKHK